jgi:hypothetical protein
MATAADGELRSMRAYLSRHVLPPPLATEPAARQGFNAATAAKGRRPITSIATDFCNNIGHKRTSGDVTHVQQTRITHLRNSGSDRDLNAGTSHDLGRVWQDSRP